MEAITVNFLKKVKFVKKLKYVDTSVVIYYHKGRTFTEEALIKFLDAYGYDRPRGLKYHTEWSLLQEVYAPASEKLDSDEICVAEIDVDNNYRIWLCPDYFLLDKVE